MGLDMMPLPRPHEGCESRFEALWLSYQIATGRLPEADQNKRQSFWNALFGRRRSEKTLKKLIDEIQEISTDAYLTLGAPVVGSDAKADNWVEQRLKDGELSPIASLEAALAKMNGYHVLELLNDCDGFPVYSNHFLPGSNIDRVSFRGEFLRNCVDVLRATQIKDAWEPKLSRDLLAYGQSLRDAAHQAAVTEGLIEVIDQHDSPDALAKSFASQIHIADSCGRWCIFWAKRGHGMDPDY